MKARMKRFASSIIADLLLASLAAVHADELMSGFRNPPETTKPYCCLYWLNGDITADGISKDLN